MKKIYNNFAITIVLKRLSLYQILLYQNSALLWAFTRDIISYNVANTEFCCFISSTISVIAIYERF